MYYIAIIGFTAAICSTLSGGAFLLMFVGTILWLTYGILREDIVIISANSITLLFIAYIIVVKAKNTYPFHQQERSG